MHVPSYTMHSDSEPILTHPYLLTWPQVASHAQKYFIRLNSGNKKDKRRASIHDITHATFNDVRGYAERLGVSAVHAA